MFKHRKRKGQSIVEMALIFPFFLLIIVGGIVDFGFAFYNALALQQLTNDAAIFAAERCDASAITGNPRITNFIANYQSPPISWHTANIYNATVTNLPMRDGSIMKSVSISYNSQVYTPFYQTLVNAINGNSHIRITSKAVYKVPNVTKTR